MTEKKTYKIDWIFFASMGGGMAVGLGLMRGSRPDVGFFLSLLIGAAAAAACGGVLFFGLQKLFGAKKKDEPAE